MATQPAPFRGSVLLRQALASPTEHVNQSALALQLGVSPGTVSRWIGGRGRPSPESMLELEWMFGIEPHEWHRRCSSQSDQDSLVAVKEVA